MNARIALDWSRWSRQVLDQIDWAGLQRTIRSFVPRNWGDLDLEAVAELAVRTGLPLVWLPRRDVIEELLEAESPVELLWSHRAAVLEDGLALVDECSADALAHLKQPLRETHNLLAEGRYFGAQALAASIFSDLVQGVLGNRQFPDVSKQFEADWRNDSLGRFRFAVLAAAVTPVLERFFWHDGDPMPARFHRHASSHCVRPEQYTPQNALVGFMTVVSLARELQEHLDC